ncbi:hypothetical protein MTR_8g094967 [Medicago truncatula]|uniref:Uncharacterized protein n=1 Tax=Medicago truncatula TaxID=3880 RepID=A0A072TTV7_MEDTR|nr:hypothetical protein MTR_8g094967 [Medicago truncatula]
MPAQRDIHKPNVDIERDIEQALYGCECQKCVARITSWERRRIGKRKSQPLIERIERLEEKKEQNGHVGVSGSVG